MPGMKAHGFTLHAGQKDAARGVFHPVRQVGFAVAGHVGCDSPRHTLQRQQGLANGLFGGLADVVWQGGAKVAIVTT